MFEKVNIVDLTVIIGLVIALIMAIFYALNELAMSIASTYATKDYVAQAIKEALAAATVTYDGKVTYK